MTKKAAKTARKGAPKKGSPKKGRAPMRVNYPLAIGAAAVLLAAFWLFYPVYQTRTKQQEQLAASRREYARLRTENRVLRERIAQIKKPEYIERYAREKLGLIKPGETAYVVLPPNPPRPTSKTATRTVEPTRSVEPTSTWGRISAFFSRLLAR